MGKASILLISACVCLLALPQAYAQMWYYPDGTPVRVSYFNDGYGYRPRAKADYYSAPSYRTYTPRSSNELDVRSQGDQLDLGNNRGGNTAIAQPSINAYVGRNGNAHISPEAVALSGGGSSGGGYYRSDGSYVGGGSDTAIAKPSVYAQVGDSGSLSVNPRAYAFSGDSANQYSASIASRLYRGY